MDACTKQDNLIKLGQIQSQLTQLSQQIQQLQPQCYGLPGNSLAVPNWLKSANTSIDNATREVSKQIANMKR